MQLKDMALDVKTLEIEDSSGGQRPSGLVELHVASRYIATRAEADRMVELFNGGEWPLPKAFIDALDYGTVQGTESEWVPGVV